MTDQQKMAAFLKMFHDAGVHTALVLNPPPGADGVKAEIQPDGSLTMKNKATGKKQKIT